ncbi:hypothetical protein [Glutamicibacter halophytocola]|uniref:hypothetical protein n=1 Tax=Glutamicibacter halophytocola TaxID=1933880 RepID=UPI0015C565ED|nr:hypothetical protein [Glutamicibacter halophytocola]NQD42760.1 hypothetical protein [Glutamicibacter halophytocola]
MVSSKSLGARSTMGLVALVLVSPLLFAACMQSPAEPSASDSSTPAILESSGGSAAIEEVNAVYKSFDPARLTKLTEKRNEESAGSKLTLVTEGLIEPDGDLSLPKVEGESKKSLLVSYMCRSSVEEGTLWRVDFTADSEPLNTGIESESCTENSVEMFTTRELSPAELPDALNAEGQIEIAVSIFEIEEAK